MGQEIPAALVDPAEVPETLEDLETLGDPEAPVADRAVPKDPVGRGRSVEHQAKNLLFGMSSS